MRPNFPGGFRGELRALSEYPALLAGRNGLYLGGEKAGSLFENTLPSMFSGSAASAGICIARTSQMVGLPSVVVPREQLNELHIRRRRPVRVLNRDPPLTGTQGAIMHGPVGSRTCG